MTEYLPNTGPGLIEATDAAATSSTAYRLAINTTGQGTLSTGDHDWWRVDLVAGQSYAFAVIGTGATHNTDPYLRLIGLDGATVLATSDDDLPSHNSLILYTAATSGSYYLDVSGYLTRNTGQYGIAASTGTKLNLDLSMMAGVIDTGSYWTATRGTGATVTFAFRDTYSGSLTNFAHMSATEQGAVLQIFALLTELTGLNFVQVNPGGYSDSAAILLADYSASDGTGGHASYPGSTDSASSAGDVWMNTTPHSGAVNASSWFYMALMHEIGHAIGLSHPGLYNAGIGVSITYANNAQFLQDTLAYSVMSYFGETNSGTNIGSAYAETYMLADIAALQAMYGANTATRAGDTVYGFHTNSGSTLYDFSANTIPAFCIWDGGGLNTLDCSLTPANQILRLTAGSVSSVLGFTDNISIAQGVSIRVGLGGWGNDAIYGNDLGDTLTGGVGTDTLTGGAGADVLVGDGATDGAAGDTYGILFSSGQTLKGTGLTGLPTTAMTLEFMIGFSGATAADWFFAMPGLQVMIDPTNNGAAGMWFYLNSTWSYSSISLAQLQDGNTHRVSFTWNSAGGVAAFYLDGTQVKTTTGFASGVTLAGNGTITFDPVNARLGDVRLYTTALDAATIARGANGPLANPAGAAGLVLEWSVAANGTLTNATGGTAPTLTGAPATGLIHNGSTYADTLSGGGGDDTITGGYGNDTIDGGAGNDTAVFSGPRSAYTVQATANGWIFTDSIAGRDGRDTVTQVESFNFGGTLTSLSALMASMQAAPVFTSIGPAITGYLDTGGVSVTPAALTTIAGQGIAGEVVTVYQGASVLATTTVQADGTWAASALLAQGNAAFWATQADGSGNSSLASASLAYNVAPLPTTGWTLPPAQTTGAAITLFDTGSQLAPSATAAGGSWLAAITLLPADGSTSAPAVNGPQTLVTRQVGTMVVDTAGGMVTLASNSDGKTSAQETRSGTTSTLFFASDGHVLSEAWTQNGTLTRVQNFNADGSVAMDQTGLHATLDLYGMSAGATTLSYAENAAHTGGTVTLAEGNLHLALSVAGHYTVGDFVIAADGHGGLTLSTLGHDPVFPGL